MVQWPDPGARWPAPPPAIFPPFLRRCNLKFPSLKLLTYFFIHAILPLNFMLLVLLLLFSSNY